MRFVAGFRAVPEAAGIVEVTAGRAARRPSAVAQDRQLADLDAHVPFVGPALLYDGSRQPRPRLPVALLFLLRARVVDLDRALIREPAVVVLVVHDLAPLPEPGGRPVWLSLALRAAVTQARPAPEVSAPNGHIMQNYPEPGKVRWQDTAPDRQDSLAKGRIDCLRGRFPLPARSVKPDL